MQTNKILRWVTLIGLFIIPFVPLLVSSGSYFPFITGKGFAFRVIVEIVFASWLILALCDRNYLPKKSGIFYSVLGLLFVSILATIFSINPYRSFWSNYERMGGLISLLHIGAYFVVLVSVLKKKVEWFWFANTAVLVNCFIGFYSLMQLAGKYEIHQGGVRLDATLGNSAYLAVYLLFNIFVLVYLALGIKIKWLKAFYLVLASLDVALLYYTATRGTILGLIGGLAITSLLYFVFGANPKVKKIAGVFLVSICLLVGGFLLVKNTDFVKSSQVLSRFSSISLTEATTQSRFLIWNMSWQGFKEHPVLGWGPENYSLVFSKYYDPLMWRQEPWFDRSHNIFFDWLIDAGILGLLAYLSLFISTLYYLWLKRKEIGLSVYVLAGLLFGYFFHNIFVFDNLISYIFFFSLIAFIHVVVTEKNNEEGEKEFAVKKDYQIKNKKVDEINLTVTVSSIIIIIATVYCLYVVNYKPYKVSVDLIRAIHPNVKPEDSLKIFQQIFSADTFGSGEAREQLVTKTIGVMNNPNVSNEIKSSFAKLTDEQIKVHLATYTDDARSNLLFGSYFSTLGQVDAGLTFLNKASSLSPKKQQILFELGSTYVQKQDATNAVRVIKMAYDLEPNYVEARKIYAVISLMTGQNKLASELIAPIKNSADYYNDDRFVNLYKQNGDNASLQEMISLREKNK